MVLSFRESQMTLFNQIIVYSFIVVVNGSEEDRQHVIFYDQTSANEFKHLQNWLCKIQMIDQNVNQYLFDVFLSNLLLWLKSGWAQGRVKSKVTSSSGTKIRGWEGFWWWWGRRKSKPQFLNLCFMHLAKMLLSDGISFISRCLETGEKLVGRLHVIKLGGVEAGFQVVVVRSGWGVVLLLQ